MNRTVKQSMFLVVSAICSLGVIHFLAIPTLMNYRRLALVMNRVAYTEATLTIFLFFSIWLFFLQLERRRFSAIYLYLVFLVYLFLLFVVLFTKAPVYHSYSLDLWDFLVPNKRVIMEAVLNVLYFIPLGVLIGFRAKWWEFLLIAFTLILGIETLQYVFYLGTFAVSDILLNFIGCLLGYFGLSYLTHHYQIQI